MKRFVLLLTLTMLWGGCSGDYWKAQFHMMKAENAFMKAYQLKTKKVAYEERLQYYQKACQHFLKAYQYDRSLFTLTRIQEAADSCWRINDLENRDQFRQFEEEYAQGHPLEYEYGDAGVSNVTDNV